MASVSHPSLIIFKAPKDDKRVITLCRPFVVIPKTTYSSPLTLPLGLAYLGGELEKAGYNWKEQAPRHPNTEGHKIFAEELYKFYNKVYK